MRNFALVAVMLGTLLGPSPARAYKKDIPGATDHPLFSRMPNFVIATASVQEFAAQSFINAKGKEEQIEGKRFDYEYYLKDGEKDPGALAVKRNYVNAAKTIGGIVTRDEPARAHIVVRRGAQEIWVLISAYGGSYRLTILERASMTQSVAASADALESGLAASGHASVGGILFDTGKSELKAESAEAVAEVAKLLTKRPALKVAVVGHTDSVGDPAANVKLSSERAASVLRELVTKHGIAAGRLSAFGAGPYSPVASNAAEDGRALNRRVELVEQ
jgi:outer membrane protein OmpA-like peptidoglycan-associated protein